MNKPIKRFRLFVRQDEKSREIASQIRLICTKQKLPLVESTDSNCDLAIVVGGDGTFIDAVTSTHFSQDIIYTGIHTGTLGFLQDLCADDFFHIIQNIDFEQELKTRKLYTAFVKIFLKNGLELPYYALNEVLVVGKNYSKISFSEYVNGELLQNVSGNGIVIATSTGDTAYSLNSNGAIDLSNNFQLVCTLETPIKNAAYERFITNPIICSQINIVLQPADNITIIIDGKKKNIDSLCIDRVEVSMIDDSNYIRKLDTMLDSKIGIIRRKILGYDFNAKPTFPL